MSGENVAFFFGFFCFVGSTGNFCELGHRFANEQWKVCSGVSSWVAPIFFSFVRALFLVLFCHRDSHAHHVFVCVIC